MTSLIITDDCIGASFIQYRQLCNFLLDRVHPSEERVDVRRIHPLTGIDKRDLGLVLARRETTCSAGKCAVGCDTDAGPDHSHDNPRESRFFTHASRTWRPSSNFSRRPTARETAPEISFAGLPLRATREGSDR